jgi:hypothetical protein
MNKELLREVKAHILAEPLRLYMSTYVIKKTENSSRYSLTDIYGNPRPFPECGTVGCIAGWGGLLHPIKRVLFEASNMFKPRFDSDKGWRGYAKMFDLTPTQAERLFEPRAWPVQFRAGTFNDGRRKTAELAAACIDFFIKTDGTDIDLSAETEKIDEREFATAS